MDAVSVAGFLAVVMIGSYVQAVAGFAMGMLIIAVAGGLRLLDLPTLAAVVSLLTIVNVVLSLLGETARIHRHMFAWLALGQAPAIFAGLMLLDWLDANVLWLLELCLGAFITLGGLSMWLKPHPWARLSGPVATWLAGASGGLMGGLFSASGPVLGWFGYSQPLPAAAIRATLLASFSFTTATRTALVGARGELTPDVLGYAGLGLPMVLLGTWLGRAFVPVLDDRLLKQFACVVLLAMGAWILASAWVRSSA